MTKPQPKTDITGFAENEKQRALKNENGISNNNNLSRRGFFGLLSASAAGSLLTTYQSSAQTTINTGTLPEFNTPAFIEDLPNDDLQAQMNAAWDANCRGWTQQAILGNPWTAKNAAHQDNYFDPTKTDVPGDAIQAMIEWPAFPNRIRFYYENNSFPFYDDTTARQGLNTQQQQQLAELGNIDGRDLGNILQNCACDPYVANATPLPPLTGGGAEAATYQCASDTKALAIPYGPYGPRGWLDEYCEMARRLNAAGKIEKIHFTCENSEYWHTLWSIDPSTVVKLYNQILFPNESPEPIKEADLFLYGPDGQVVIDPSTQQAAYNPLNKWNSGLDWQAGARVADKGTTMTDNYGGAVHLTSTPNTLPAELQLATGASVERNLSGGNLNASTLICCGQYGQIFRNSDPHIGQLDNQIVGLTDSSGNGYRVTLANPIGLYIQMPDFSTWHLPKDKNLPADARPEELWCVVRGAKTLPGFPPHMNFILHARVEIPQRWFSQGADTDLSLEDISINGAPIKYASQVMQSFNVALFPLAIKATDSPAPQACVVDKSEDTMSAFPQQIMYAELWDAYYQANYTVPWRKNSGEPSSEVTMNLASNSVIRAPQVVLGKEGTECATVSLVLIGDHFLQSSQGKLPSVNFLLPNATEADTNINTEVTALENIFYTVPGNSLPSEQQLLRLNVTIKTQAATGPRNIQVINPSSSKISPPTAPWFLEVVALET